MKKFSIFLMLLMGVFLPWAANAQQTAVLNDGTTTMDYVPFYGLYADYGAKGQFIIPATDLADKGITSGCQISKLKFFSSATSTGTFFGTSVKVEVGEVSYTSFSSNAFVTSGLTTVLSGTSLSRSSDGTMVVSFSSNYTYTGGNLLISIGGYGSGCPSTSWYGVSSTNAGVYGYNSSNNQTIPSSASGRTSYAPKTEITYLPNTPYITLTPTAATVLTGSTQTLTATYGNVSGTPTITYSSGNTNVATVSGNGTTATVTGVAPGTATITASMTYQGTTYTATCAITVEDPSYCTPNPSSRDGNGITALTFGSNPAVNNSSSSGLPASSPFYGDYTSMVGATEAGQQVTVNITYSTGTSTVYSYGTIIWVDWNENYTFEDSEIVATGTSPQGSGGTPQQLTLSFTVPANQAADDYRMRIAGADSYFDNYIGGNTSANHSPCFSSTYAVCHDYTLRVLAAGAYTITCNTTTNGIISVNHGSADAGETITVTAVPETNYELTALSYNDGSDHNISFSNNQGTFTMPAADVTVNATFSIMRNIPPYDLTVGTPLGHSVELGWTGVSTNTNHQNYEVYYSTTNTAPSDNLSSGYETTTTVPYTLAGLDPSTTYYAWVRDNCGTDGKSTWVAFTSFTTDVACPAPTNVTASNVTNNSATISWESSNAESYNVRYRPTTNGFQYGFEDAEPWTITDFSPCTIYDGDGQGTYGFQDNTFTNNGYTGSLIAFQGDWGDNAYPAHSGNAFGAFFNPGDASTENDWFILPEITIENGYVFSFWARELTDQYNEYSAVGGEEFKVGVCSTSGTFSSYLAGDASSAVVVSTTTWTQYSYNLSDYVGQTIKLAINCVSTDVFALFIDDIFVGDPNAVPTWIGPFPEVTSPYPLTGLTGNTDYEVQVQANCGSEDGTSEWVGTTFTTLDGCALPYELNTTNITAASASLNWTGAQESYNVRYHIAGEKLEEGFENGSMPEDWNTIGAGVWSVGQGAGTSTLSSTYEGLYNVKGSHSTTNNDYYLIMPALDLSEASNLNLSLYYANPYYSSGYQDIDGFGVYYRVNEGEWNELFYTTEKHNEWTPLTVALTGLDANYQIGFRMHDNWGGGVAIDNISLVISTGSEWVNKPNVTSPLAIDGLTPMTNYEWQVQGIDCDGNGTATDWSETATFTTVPQFTKDITAYTGETDHYYLIASPITADVTPSADNGFLTSAYDLYYFNQDGDTDGNEWINYESTNDGGYDIVNGKGYLYASSTNTSLVFTGSAYSGNGQVNLTYSTANADATMHGWNLVGNPFAKTAHIDMPFYTLDGEAEYQEHIAGDDINPMQGILVHTDANKTLTFSTDSQGAKSASLTMNVTKDRSVIDRAIVCFSEGSQLPKFQLNPNHTKVYMPKDGKDYAVVNGEENGEMPVNFKAENNGTYTISFTTEEVSFGYLHLIDNMNGNDVDLLATPSYSFEAKATDHENRFKLVFATGNSDDDAFAFYSNGSFVINNEGEATLQVIDVNGRILKSESINGCANVNVNAAQGIYMLRLMNGENVKVQKMVVR